MIPQIQKRSVAFILEQQLWTVHDVLRFCREIKLLPERDISVLLSQAEMMEDQLKAWRVREKI